MNIIFIVSYGIFQIVKNNNVLNLPVPTQAWAFVGHGSNMRSRSSYSVNPPTVIVSRSHSGKVKSFIQEAFGNTTIIPAGGAGE